MTFTLADPASNVRDEIATSSGMPELPEKIWFHKTASAVIDAERCVGCGGCIAACPSRSIGVGEDGKPTLVKMCTGCSACWDYCPLAGFRVERLTKLLSSETSVNNPHKNQTELCIHESELLGKISAVFSARAVAKAPGAQDGGAITSLLCSLMEAGEIDGAILTRKLDAFHSESFLATSVEEISSAAGSVYHQSHPLAQLNQALPAGVNRIAFVGTPCQINVLRILQKFTWKHRTTAASNVVLAIALFCTRSFNPDKLENAVADFRVDTKQVSRIDIRDGNLVVQDHSGSGLLEQPVKAFSGAALPGCDECFDFSGLNADLAVGNVGSERGNSTIVVRSHMGEKALALAGSSLELHLVEDLSPVMRLAKYDKERAEKASPRGLDPDANLWVSYSEHLINYSGTERAPKAPPAHRSCHYEVSC